MFGLCRGVFLPPPSPHYKRNLQEDFLVMLLPLACLPYKRSGPRRHHCKKVSACNFDEVHRNKIKHIYIYNLYGSTLTVLHAHTLNKKTTNPRKKRKHPILGHFLLFLLLACNFHVSSVARIFSCSPFISHCFVFFVGCKVGGGANFLHAHTRKERQQNPRKINK